MTTDKISESLYNKGIIHYEKGEYTQAIESFKKAIEKNATNPQFYYNLGLAYVKIDQDDLAVSNFKEAINLNPNDADALQNLGIVYNKKALFEEAIKAYKESLKIKPNDHDCYDNLGISYFSIDKLKEAIECFEKALNLCPQNKQIASNLAFSYFTGKQYKIAEERFLYVISLDNQDSEAYFNLGKVYLELKDIVKARENFEKALAIDVDNKSIIDAINNLEGAEDIPVVQESPKPDVTAFIENGNFDVAIDVLSKAIEENPEEPENHYNLGKVYLEQKDYNQAIERLKDTLTLDSNHKEAQTTLYNVINTMNATKEDIEFHYRLALAYAQKKEYDKAIEELKTTLSFTPEKPEARLLLTKLQQVVNS
jgi:tetratricopeptide (TPR) repeat protein